MLLELPVELLCRILRMTRKQLGWRTCKTTWNLRPSQREIAQFHLQITPKIPITPTPPNPVLQAIGNYSRVLTYSIMSAIIDHEAVDLDALGIKNRTPGNFLTNVRHNTGQMKTEAMDLHFITFKPAYPFPLDNILNMIANIFRDKFYGYVYLHAAGWQSHPKLPDSQCTDLFVLLPSHKLNLAFYIVVQHLQPPNFNVSMTLYGKIWDDMPLSVPPALSQWLYGFRIRGYYPMPETLLSIHSI